MYEAILGKIDAAAAALGLGRKSHRVLPGENPWAYSGGEDASKEEKAMLSTDRDARNRAGSASSSVTLVEKTGPRRS